MRKVHKFDTKGLSEKAIKLLIIHHNKDVRGYWASYGKRGIPKVELKTTVLEGMKIVRAK